MWSGISPGCTQGLYVAGDSYQVGSMQGTLPTVLSLLLSNYDSFLNVSLCLIIYFVSNSIFALHSVHLQYIWEINILYWAFTIEINHDLMTQFLTRIHERTWESMANKSKTTLYPPLAKRRSWFPLMIFCWMNFLLWHVAQMFSSSWHY